MPHWQASAVYLFSLLPLAAFFTALTKHRAGWAAVVTVTLLFLELFGGNLTPPSPVVRARAGGPTLTAMTYNVLFTNTDAAPIVANIRNANPDLIAFQELTHTLEGQLAQELGGTYPYHTPLHTGCNAQVTIWSRYPLQVESVEEDVLCRVRSVVLNLDGHRVRVVNVHGWPYIGIDRESVELGFGWRQEQVECILDNIEGQPESLILLGDLNSTPMHEAYQALSTRLVDSFGEAGWGLGHTFPTAGGRYRSFPYPGLLVRIDHVFHSRDWKAEATWVGEWDGHSDHRPVIARLTLHNTD